MAIHFYSKTEAYAEFSNFSPHAFSLEGKSWPSVEHWFQAQKFPSDPAAQERIRLARTPGRAKSLGRSRKLPLRPDWEAVKEGILRRGMRAKFEAHPELRALLLSTGEEELVEASPGDAYWGCGREGRGKNRCGVLLMEVRAALTRAAQGGS